MSRVNDLVFERKKQQLTSLVTYLAFIHVILRVAGLVVSLLGDGFIEANIETSERERDDENMHYRKFLFSFSFQQKSFVMSTTR